MNDDIDCGFQNFNVSEKIIFFFFSMQRAKGIVRKLEKIKKIQI